MLFESLISAKDTNDMRRWYIQLAVHQVCTVSELRITERVRILVDLQSNLQSCILRLDDFNDCSQANSNVAVRQMGFDFEQRRKRDKVPVLVSFILVGTQIEFFFFDGETSADCRWGDAATSTSTGAVMLGALGIVRI